ncbi:MAG: PilN domain-containing protein [Deltaproteobacteria bacterium]|nr:PilN domain-containing protein [Deltaproteobacteria bacterium]
MIRINLLSNWEERRRLRAKRELTLMGGGLFWVLLLMVSLHLFFSSGVKGMQSAIQQLQQEITRLQQVSEEVDTFKRKKEILEEKLKVISALEEGKLNAVKILDQLASSIPTDSQSDIPQKLWLTSYKEVGTKVEFIGMALSPEGVAEFLMNLDRSPYFDTVVLHSTEWVEEKGIQLTRFQIRCELRIPPIGDSVGGLE